MEDNTSPYFQPNEGEAVPSGTDNTIVNDTELFAAIEYETELTVTGNDPIPDTPPSWASELGPK